MATASLLTPVDISFIRTILSRAWNSFFAKALWTKKKIIQKCPMHKLKQIIKENYTNKTGIVGEFLEWGVSQDFCMDAYACVRVCTHTFGWENAMDYNFRKQQEVNAFTILAFSAFLKSYLKDLIKVYFKTCRGETKQK